METLTQSKLAFDGATLRDLIDRPCWEIAERLGLGYSGDSSLIHDGVFYDPSDWKENGYANAVSVQSDAACVFITSGQIHRLDVENALRSCGWRYAGGDAERYDCEPGDVICEHDGTLVASGDGVIDCEISACEAYAGVEPDCDYGGTDDYVCPIVETSSGEYFQFCELNSSVQNISLDCLEGFIVRKFLIRMLPQD
jgi:hypothetical protein